MAQTAEVSVTVSAPTTDVWHALTDPHIVKLYFFNTTMTTNWQVGSNILFNGEWDGKYYQDKGTVLEFEPGEHLAYSYWSSMSGLPDTPTNYQRIEYTVEPVMDGTKVTVTQECKAEEKSRCEDNWRKVLGAMKELLERKNKTPETQINAP